MLIATVTGGSRGIGAWVVEFLESQSYQVEQFSISEGSDISSSKVREKILEATKNSSIFINNAHSGYAQCELLDSIFRSWRYQQKLIVNIGCSSFSPAIWNLVETSYCAEKAALHVLSERLQQMERKCRITTIQTGLVGVSSTHSISAPKINKEEFYSILNTILTLPETTEIRTIRIDKTSYEHTK